VRQHRQICDCRRDRLDVDQNRLDRVVCFSVGARVRSGIGGRDAGNEKTSVVAEPETGIRTSIGWDVI
jgi:hypothetical protein